ncbi:MFS transporter [Catenulispora yoronensis]|uniref:MFS transporter n=1 Tax=Catenulispora yoronensis TaxID=450799 RepID=A0ABN2TJ26_9ACTN
MALDKTGGTPPAAPAPDDDGFRWGGTHVVVLIVVCLALLLELIDISVVNLALPTIKTDLGFSQDDLQWVVNAYTVLFGGFLLLGGRTGDLVGAWRVFQIGLVVFMGASLASGLAQDGGTLVATRAVQGIAAAFVSPMTLAIIASVFPEGKHRNKAVGIWGATAGISTALGVILGGVIVNEWGWRWIFYINLPLGLVMLALTVRYFNADRPERGNRNFDVVGAVTATAGLSLLAYAVVQTDSHSWGSARTLGLLAGSAVLLGWFGVHESRFATEPLFPFSLLRNRTVSGANLVQTLFGGAMFSMLFLISLYQQQVLHFSALKAGLGELPFTAVLVLFAPLGPVLLPKIGLRPIILIGSVVSAGSLVLFAEQASPTAGLGSAIIVPGIVLGVGMSLLFIPLTIAAVEGVPPEQHGIASGVLNMTRTVGGAIGLAVISTVVASRTSHRLLAGRPTPVALTDGFRLGFTISAVLMALCAVAAVVVFRGSAATASATIPGPTSGAGAAGESAAVAEA